MIMDENETVINVICFTKFKVWTGVDVTSSVLYVKAETIKHLDKIAWRFTKSMFITTRVEELHIVFFQIFHHFDDDSWNKFCNKSTWNSDCYSIVL